MAWKNRKHMCGIAGIIGERPGLALEERLNALNGHLRHRGPDDAGLWISPEGLAGLAHTRLSILDLSASGHQPMTSPDGRLVITFNGEIFNFRELREELEREGVVFRSHSDTEVLLHLYQRHGAAMLPKLRGMFAFCIWDECERSAFLARDPLGIKPLYHSSRADGSLVFASELKALRRAGLVSSGIDPAALTAYFETGSVPEPLTLLQGARCLEAGHWLRWQGGKIEKTCYWKPRFEAGTELADDASGAVRDALLDSVRHHFVSDVPVGIFLSGGIDSTALVALARETGVRDLETFSIGVNDARLDESSVAKATAGIFGTRHHEFRLGDEAAEAAFSEFLQCGDQPSIDGFNTFIVSRFARQRGVKVVLSGLGGDELFGGYPSFVQVPRLARLNRMLHAVPGLAPFIGSRMEHRGTSPRVRRLGGMLRRPPGMAGAYRALRSVFSPRIARLLAARIAPEAAAMRADFDAYPLEAHNELDQVSELEITRYMRNQLLKDSDVMSMAHGLELRVPFVDSHLFEKAARIPASQRLRPGKKMLLEAVPEIPAQVAAAPKRGFVFPFEKWLQGSRGGEFTRMTASLPARNPTWYQRWCVFVLERWLEQG